MKENPWFWAVMLVIVIYAYLLLTYKDSNITDVTDRIVTSLQDKPYQRGEKIRACRDYSGTALESQCFEGIIYFVDSNPSRPDEYFVVAARNEIASCQGVLVENAALSCLKNVQIRKSDIVKSFGCCHQLPQGY